MSEQAPSKKLTAAHVHYESLERQPDDDGRSVRMYDADDVDNVIEALQLELKSVQKQLLAMDGKTPSLGEQETATSQIPSTRGNIAASGPRNGPAHEPPAALWGDGTREMLIELRDWMRSKMPCNAGDCCSELRGWIEKVDQRITHHAPAATSQPQVPDDGRDAARWRHAVLEICHSFDGQDRTYYLKAFGRESFTALIDRRIALTKCNSYQARETRRCVNCGGTELSHYSAAGEPDGR